MEPTYSIGEVARLTGITAFTLRYYEKIGLLPPPVRQGGNPRGIRRYTELDVRFIRFIHGLKETGMRLEDIGAFAEDGCLLTPRERDMPVEGVLHKRVAVLEKHTEQLDRELERLQAVKALAQEKLAFYSVMLERNTVGAGENGMVREDRQEMS